MEGLLSTGPTPSSFSQMLPERGAALDKAANTTRGVSIIQDESGLNKKCGEMLV